MESEEYGIERFKADYDQHSIERAKKKEIIGVPFTRHLDLYKNHSLEAQRFMGFIIDAKKAGDHAVLSTCIMQYKHHRKQQNRSLARLTHYQELGFWLDGLYDYLEDAIVMNSISEVGVEGMKKAIEASRVTADNIWDLEKMNETLQTSLATILSKMKERSEDDYLNDPVQQPAEPDVFDDEIDQAIRESEDDNLDVAAG